ncbi:MAG: hypothetical protein KDH09_01230 [Chrysiogenetes bacterium]|nr:hypothetical protein [Chrysiogenetes bacterium]
MNRTATQLLVLMVFAATLVLGLPGRAHAGRFDRAGTWNGELGVGAFILDDESGFSVSGRARYYFTDHLAVGPAVTAGFTDNIKVYNLRMLLRMGTVLGEKSSSPFEIYAEAGAGAIIFDYDANPTAIPPTLASTDTALVIPFGGGFVWHIAPGFGIQGGALMNVTTDSREEFYPEFFAGIFF